MEDFFKIFEVQKDRKLKKMLSLVDGIGFG